MPRSKQCSVCDKKNVDTTAPQGLTCTYCGAVFHAECSATFSKVGLDTLAIVKEVCTPCPGCEFALRQLPAKVASLEKRLQDFVEKTESALTNVLSASHVAATSAVQSQCTPVNKDVNKAVKEALSHQENRRSLVISGIKESISQDEDARFVKDLFSYLGEKDVVVVDCFRLGKPLVTRSTPKPCLLKVSLANSNQRTSILKKAKLLKDSDHFKQIFVRPSNTLVERIHIKSLYNTLQSQQEETGVNHFIDRRGPVNLWTVKRKDLPKVPSVNGGFTASASNCPTKGN